MADKGKFRFINKKGFDYIFEELETGTEVSLKIFKDKDFKDKIQPGEEGFGIVNTNWLNTWEPIEVISDEEVDKLNAIDNEAGKEKVSGLPKENDKFSELLASKRPDDIRQLLIMGQSCQHDATELIAQGMDLKAYDTVEDVAKEVAKLRDCLLKDLVRKYWK